MNKQRISSLCIPVSIPGRSSLLVIGLALLLASTFAAASTPQGHFEKTFQVSGPVELEVQTRSGDVIVRSGAAGTVAAAAGRGSRARSMIAGRAAAPCSCAGFDCMKP